jgi:hypothetical protein
MEVAMPIVKKGIIIDEDKFLSFGNYNLKEKHKITDFDFFGEKLELKTYQKNTRLKKNGMIFFESIPGSAVHKMNINNSPIQFYITGLKTTDITISLQPDTMYRIYADNSDLGETKSTMSGKITFSLDLDDIHRIVKIEKV